MRDLNDRMLKQAHIFNDMICMFSVLLDKGVLTSDEIIAKKELLEAESKNLHSQFNEDTSSPEGSSIQSEEARNDEDSSGSGE